MSKSKPMKQISSKQAAKNRQIAKIKQSLIEETGGVCRICGGYGNDTAHLLPKSCYPEYYLEPRNLVILCRNCHNLYDNDLLFRKRQKSLISQACEFAFEHDIHHYFKL